MNSLTNLYLADKLTLEQVRSQIEEKNYPILDRMIMQTKAKPRKI